MPFTPLVEVRRSLHSNYNCRDIDSLDRWYSALFELKPVMRSESNDTDAWAFGVRKLTHTDTLFLYDHRGARRSTSLELVAWIDHRRRGRRMAATSTTDPDGVMVELVHRPRAIFR